MKSHSTDQLNQRVDRVTKLLRTAGSLLLVASASTFLLQRWDSGNDVIKYLFLLSHTVMAVVAGLLCGTRVKESRAARTFLLIAVSVIPMNFAVSGGFLYSRFALDSSAVALPQYASWITESPLLALGLAALTVVVTGLTVKIAATPLIRGHVGAFLATYLGANAMLWIPIRLPELAGVLALAALAIATWFELRVGQPESRLKTREGRILRGMLWVPAGFVIGRSLLFYQVDAFLFSPLLAAVGLSLWWTSRRWFEPRASGLLELAGTLVTACSWVPLAFELKQRWFPHTAFHPLAGLPVSALLLALSLRSRSTKYPQRVLAAATAMASCALALLTSSSLLTGITTLAVGLIIVCYAMLSSVRWLEVLALLLAALGLVCAVTNALGVESLLNWGSLSALGALLVFSAAALERNRGRLVHRLMRRELLSQVRSEAGFRVPDDAASRPSATPAPEDSSVVATTPGASVVV